ncbi:hypothetical protein CL616_04245 [archaeon]|nr:hypothetical protein [archaeon]
MKKNINYLLKVTLFLILIVSVSKSQEILFLNEFFSFTKELNGTHGITCQYADVFKDKKFVKRFKKQEKKRGHYSAYRLRDEIGLIFSIKTKDRGNIFYMSKDGRIEDRGMWDDNVHTSFSKSLNNYFEDPFSKHISLENIQRMSRLNYFDKDKKYKYYLDRVDVRDRYVYGKLYEMFIHTYLQYGFDNLQNFFDYEYKIEPTSFKVRHEYKNEFNELSSTFLEYLIENNKEFFKPYKKTVFVKTGEDYSTDMYSDYRSAGVDPLLAMNYSKVSTGYNTQVEAMRTAYISHKETIKPSWDEIKEYYGGLKGLMDNGISKEDDFSLDYSVDKIEFTYEPQSSKIVSALFITMETTKKGFHSEKLKDGNKIKVIGEAKLKDNPFHVPQEIIIECIFPDNPSEQTVFEISLKDISDSQSYKGDFNNLKSLFSDEVEILFKKIPYTTYSKKTNTVWVLFNDNK